MSKKELIESSNKILSDFENNNKANIKLIIKNSVIDKNLKIINSKDDLSGSNGFYMIFCSKEKNESDCSCTINKDGNDYYCVYRGHSSNIKSRLESHLFYDKNSKYPNCMKIMIENRKYNLNIETKKVYAGKKTVENVVLPSWNWGVIHIPLTGSKKALREMFENVFDGLFSKPIFSDK